MQKNVEYSLQENLTGSSTIENSFSQLLSTRFVHGTHLFHGLACKLLNSSNGRHEREREGAKTKFTRFL